jgi:hypothetical protein
MIASASLQGAPAPLALSGQPARFVRELCTGVRAYWDLQLEDGEPAPPPEPSMLLSDLTAEPAHSAGFASRVVLTVCPSREV